VPKDDIDEMDRRIICMLQENARIPLKNMAAKIGVSTPTISDRLSRLIRNKVILGFRTEVDWAKLGFDLLCFTNVLTKYGKGHAVAAARKLAKIKGVAATYFVMGDLDFIVIFRAKDKRDVARITDEFEEIGEIVRTNTHVVMKTIKDEFYGPM
jgi:Lrp/AsnC family transcriptional regulator for asnA, asnC and gidA